MRRMAWLSILFTTLVVVASTPLRAGTRASDRLFWVPTLEQAIAMATHTGRPIFLTFYTCVGERSPTYSGRTTVW